MITGIVGADEGRIRLTIKGTRQQDQELDAVIDTGFTASLSLPPSVIAALGLPWQSFDRGVLADGSECYFDVYEAEVIWDGASRRVLIDKADTDPLVGMTLMGGYELRMEIRSGGTLTIKKLAD
jgi:clan AA aspartic protease